ncbi:MAG: four helix bundle protein [Acidobacteria bacterium]|nr:four helix bundle protein [Acidobacteriota bacterium]
MTQNEMKLRTEKFALRIINLVDNLPNTKPANVIGHQLLRSATSVGSNYRAVCRAKSAADFINKLSIVEEEADESGYWLELLSEGRIVRHEKLVALMEESDEIVAIVVAASKTSKERRNPKSQIPNPK